MHSTLHSQLRATRRCARLISRPCLHTKNCHRAIRVRNDAVDASYISPDSTIPDSAHGLMARISQVKNSLTKESSYAAKSKECFQIYHGTEHNMVLDFLLYPNVNLDVQNKVLDAYKRSKSMRALLLSELLLVAISGRIKEVSSFLHRMTTHGVLNYEEISSEADQTAHFVNYIVQLAIQEGEPLVAAQFTFDAKLKDIQIYPEIIERVVLSLAVAPSTMSNYYAYGIFKVLDVFGKECITGSTYMRVIELMLRNSDSPYFANLLYDKAKTHGTADDIAHENVTRLLLQANLSMGNIHRAAALWKRIYTDNPDFAAKNKRLFVELLSRSLAKEVQDLVNNHHPTPLDEFPELVDFLIEFYGKQPSKKKQFDTLLHSLKPPLQRPTLSLLFSAFLFQSNEKAAERIVQSIIGSRMGLNHNDFNAITEKLLRQHKLQQSIKMCSSESLSVSKRGHVRVMEFLLRHEGSSLGSASDVAAEKYEMEKAAFFKSLVARFRKLPRNDPVLQELTVSLFKHFACRASTGSARKLYITYAYAERGKVRFDFPGYQMPREFHELITINKGNRLECLSAVLAEAKAQSDQHMVAWCADELQRVGVPAADINSHYI